MRNRIANLTSNILNPFLVSLITIFLLSLAATSSTLDALRWALISIAISILPVYSATVYLVRSGRLDAIFTNARGSRTKIFLLSVLCAAADFVILSYLRAPSILVAAFTSGLLALVIFMSINLWWKISLHTAFVAASATVLVMLYGWAATPAVVLVPLIAWARLELKHHSPAQVAIGALLAALIIMVTFYPLALA